MMKSEFTGELVKALVKARAGFKPIRRTKKANIPTKSGATISYEYATLDDILAATAPALTENGLSVVQTFSMDWCLETVLLHTSGEYIGGSCPLNMPQGVSPRDAGAYLTYYRRYSLAAILSVSPEEDSDGATHEDKPNAEVKHEAKPAPATAVAEDWEIPYGKNKGVMASTLTDKSLIWYRDRVAEDLENPEKDKYRANNEKVLAILNNLCSIRAKANAEGAEAKVKAKFDAEEIPL